MACAAWPLKVGELIMIAQALPLLKAAYDRGLNTWDTANIYSNGKSEEIIAKAIKTYDIPRDKLVILTKCFAYIGEEYVRAQVREKEGKMLMSSEVISKRARHAQDQGLRQPWRSLSSSHFPSGQCQSQEIGNRLY